MAFERLERHATLVNKMADKLGVDLIEETLRGHLRPEEMRGRVYRCMGCTGADTCEKLLADPNVHLDEAPEYCRNGAEFKRVSAS